jgi:pimeloyl-ACP methyl ester carboxylesterase
MHREAVDAGTGRTRAVSVSRAWWHPTAMTETRQVDELRSLARLGFDELRRAMLGIGGVHRAVATRAFRASGPGALPARALHDAISSRVYAGLGGATRLVARAADTGLGRRAVRDGRRLSSSPGGALVVGALNGLVGDALEREDSDLQEPMSVRVGGRPVPLEPEPLAAAFPEAGPRVVVFLHGLMETEFSWRVGAGPAGQTYATRLRGDLGCTAVEVRYNSGRHISENGLSLADLMEELVAAWPVEVEQVALIGHSMGGLVARSACYQAAERGDAWAKRVRHVITLGTPHMGAPLAQGVHWMSAALHALPETRPFAGFLRRRSAGIRDLRQGSLVDADWRDCDPDALKAVACQEVPLLEGATHCFVAATVTRGGSDPVGRLVGDCLVLQPSASGRSRTRRIPFEEEYGMHVGGTHHLALLNHPRVYERMRDWLAAGVPAPRGALPAPG